MTTATFTALSEHDADEVIRWRFSQLASSGYGIEDAVTLATHLDVDLHRATDLVARGCPPRLALAILI
jgi:hypothetical protein